MLKLPRYWLVLVNSASSLNVLSLLFDSCSSAALSCSPPIHPATVSAASMMLISNYTPSAIFWRRKSMQYEPDHKWDRLHWAAFNSLGIFHLWILDIVVTYEIRVFFEGAQKEVFSSILKKNIIKIQRLENWPLYKVFFKKPKNT